MNTTLEMETEAFRSWSAALIRDLKITAGKQVLRALAFEFLNRVIAKTPVDYGRARGGWASYLLARGQPFDAGAKRTKDPGRDKKGRFTKGGGKPGVSEGSFKEKFTGAEQYIILINAVSYIVLLEYGYSDQAPAGMMRITFREMRMHRSGQKRLREEFTKAVARTNRLRRNTAPKWQKVGSLAFA